MKTNKKIKNIIDNLKEWDDFLGYTVIEIDWDIFTLDDNNHTWLVKDSWDLFDMLFEDIAETEANL